MPENPFPILTSQRLILRELDFTDRDVVQFLHSSPEVNKYVDRDILDSPKQADTFIEKIRDGRLSKGWYYWAITLKDDPTMIGSICLWNFSEDRKTAELGYDLNPKHQRQGYMNEAVQLVIQFSIDPLGLETLEAFTHRDNAASARLLEHNIFKLNPDRADENDANNIIFERQLVDFL